MTERKEDWIYIIKPNNEQRIASPAFVKKLLGIEKLDVYNIYNRLQKLEQKVDKLEEPMKKQRIIELLKSGESHNRQWLENRVEGLGWYLASKLLRELVDEGKLKITKAGTNDMYSISL